MTSSLTITGTLTEDCPHSLDSLIGSEGVILAAATYGEDKTLTQGRGKDGGIVPGHAYTILEVYSPKFTLKTGIRLIKLRNPWFVSPSLSLCLTQ
jgi:hypothetical protein